MALRKGISLHFLAIFVCLGLTLFVCSCFSQTKREDSTNYVSQARQSQGYLCPSCGHQISMENISANILIENKCLKCGKIIFGVPVAKKSQEGEKVASYGLRSHGPRSIYESDTDYQVFYVGGGYFEETEMGYSYLDYSFLDRKVKIRRVVPHWINTRYRLGRR